MSGPEDSSAGQRLVDDVTALLQAGREAEAVARCDHAIARDAGSDMAHNLLGIIAARRGDFSRALPHFERAAELAPARGEYHRNLGYAQRHAGQVGAAVLSFTEAIRLDPGDCVALFELGKVHLAQGDFAGAEHCQRRIIEREPGNAIAWLGYGHALAGLQRLREAGDAYRSALERAPALQEARFALAGVLSSLGRDAEALALYREIEGVRPDHPGLQLNLGFELKKLGRSAEAIRHYDRAIAQDPADATAYNNRGNALRCQQRLPDAIASLRKALVLKPDYAGARSNLLLSLNYAEHSQRVLYSEALQFDEQHAAALLPRERRFSNNPDPKRRLRVGYVSADFRRHSVAYFLKGVLERRDRAGPEVFCYANVERPDELTAMFRSTADQWRPIFGLSDEEVTRQVESDSVDILVDLSGHTAGNRLLVFARKPAPVQVSWLGYPNTTGMRAMDYRLTDAIADPPGEADELHTESLVRLAGGFLCYQPDGALPTTGAPRADERVTFGSFNTLAKVTPEVIAVWSEILHGVPGSRLLLKSESLDEEETQGRFLALFARHGVAAGRLELRAPIADHRQHLEFYERVDMALDPFPYNGTTTTCEALSMGVPVVALRGQRHAARVGASLLTHAGLGEWVAGSTQDYVNLAVRQAADRTRLAALRPVIRAAFAASTVTDCARLSAGLEQAYRDMWVRWCAVQG